MTTSSPSTLIGAHPLKWLLNETYRLRGSCYSNGCTRNGVPISKWICYSYSISIKWLWICLYIWSIRNRIWNSISIWNLKGCSIASTDTASSQHRLWITPIIIRASWYGVGSSALVMAPLTSKGNWKECYWCQIRSLYRRSGPLFVGQYLTTVGLRLMVHVGGTPESKAEPMKGSKPWLVQGSQPLSRRFTVELLKIDGIQGLLSFIVHCLVYQT